MVTRLLRLSHADAMSACHPAAKTILILDEDLGFVFWLGRILDKAGYRVLPARSGSDARALLSELDVGLDVLVANPDSGGAAVFIEDQRRRAEFNLIMMHAEDEPHEMMEGVDAVMAKPETPNVESELEWVHLVEVVLHRGKRRGSGTMSA
jgi:DNA-binding NtrC family response regulator